MTKQIPLTQGLFSLVDDEDYEALNSRLWYAEKDGRQFYARTAYFVNGKSVHLTMHRVINNTPAGMVTDHINGFGLDNRRANLRSATHRENAVNCAAHRGSSSKYRGVSLIKGNRWRAVIRGKGKTYHIGCFATEFEAHVAYEAYRAKALNGMIYQSNSIAEDLPATA